MNMFEKIKFWSETRPNLEAFVTNNVSLTYKELEELSSSLSCYIHEQLGDNFSPVVVYGHMEPFMLVCFLAVVKSGRAYIPIDSSIPIDRVNGIIEDSGTKMILSPSKLPFTVPDVSTKIVESDDLTLVLNEYHGKFLEHHNYVKEDETFYIIYTSGSTGKPKGVQISYNNLMSFVNWMKEDFDLIEQSIFLNQAPFSFDLSVMDLYPCLFLGGTLKSITKEMIAQPKLMFDHLLNSGIEIWTSTPSFADLCLMDSQFSEKLLPNLKTFLFCGETLSNETARKLMERFPKSTIFNTYGPTEATVAVTGLKIDENIVSQFKSLPIGYPKNDTKVLILNEQHKPVPEGEKGQIVIVGPSVSKGYFNRPDLTKNSFFLYDGLPAYQTGDIGYYEEGLLFYSGRMDFQIKMHGYRIEIEEIEAHLKNLTLIDNAVVVPILKEDKCESLTAVIVANKHNYEKEFQLTSALKKELQLRIPSYMIPRKFIYVSFLPMTSNGKVDRKKITNEVTT